MLERGIENQLINAKCKLGGQIKPLSQGNCPSSPKPRRSKDTMTMSYEQMLVENGVRTMRYGPEKPRRRKGN